MKKLFIMAAAGTLAAVGATSCGGNAKMTTDTDSLAYSAGIVLGTMAYRMDSTMNPNLIAAAIKDVYAKKGKMTDLEADAFMREYMMNKFIRESAAKNTEFIEKAVADGAQTLPSGLVYKIENAGSDRKVAVGDSIYAKYKLTLPDGQLVEEQTNAVPFLLEEGKLIKGWIEGIPQIGEGGKITLFVPADLAYGEQGHGPIAPNQALQFDIEVTKVVPAPTK
ncbi:FKBP-type peptidyl-prolyl cis-trans isomerase [uncultured Rikenella sp.]|uniref:FKBP-type peptidyl-prolyl cis-trans isomerase n=1 Tax=uncultured Rikenella sp. TaxID=368003 RepID=UPI0025F411AD|nr:FKBP-type peptidyl-prolyl cis-trans isomerase [uncultured Rikenella sp.]